MADDVETIRRAIGSGDRLVPGTLSEAEHEALLALDRLAEENAELRKAASAYLNRSHYHGTTEGAEAAVALRAALAREEESG